MTVIFKVLFKNQYMMKNTFKPTHVYLEISYLLKIHLNNNAICIMNYSVHLVHYNTQDK